jgi:hypothetical protein
MSSLDLFPAALGICRSWLICACIVSGSTGGLGGVLLLIVCKLSCVWSVHRFSLLHNLIDNLGLSIQTHTSSRVSARFGLRLTEKYLQFIFHRTFICPIPTIAAAATGVVARMNLLEQVGQQLESELISALP